MTAARRGLVMGALTVVALAALGLRAPDSSSALAQAKKESSTEAAATGVGYDLRFVADQGGVVVALRPSQLANHPALRETVGALKLPTVFGIPEATGWSVADIDQCVLSSRPPFGPPAASAYLRASRPLSREAWSSTIQRMAADGSVVRAQYSGQEVTEFVGELAGLAMWTPDENSLVLDTPSNIRRYIDGRVAPRELLDSEVFRRLADRAGVVVVETQILRTGFPGNPAEDQPAMIDFVRSLLGPVFEESQVLGLGVTSEDDVSVTAIARCLDATGAVSVAETTRAALTLAGNGLREAQLRGAAADGKKQRAVSLLAVADALVKQARVEQDGQFVVATASARLDAALVRGLIPSIAAANRAAARESTLRNLKLIALAFHNYHDVYKRFPYSANVASRDQRPGSSAFPHSWRVAILPYLGESALYEQYRFDEPWDSESNLKLIPRMPAVYRHSETPEATTDTSYFVITGPGTIFVREREPKIASVWDGTSNTLLVVETKRAVPWTKPDDILYDANGPLPQLGGFGADGFNAAFADGSARFISAMTDPQTLRAWITATGGETIRER
jgi:hypothetical protein